MHEYGRAAMRSALYTIMQAIWGFPQTALGGVLFLAHARKPHFRYHSAVVTTWKSPKAVSLGLFIFLPEMHNPTASKSNLDDKLLVHEYGHTIQSLILGPLYLPIVGLPSLLWLNVPACTRYRQRTGVSYYAFYTEHLANRLGELVLKEETPTR